MENISYPRYLGKSMKVEPEHRLSSCRIEIRPNKISRTSGSTSPSKSPGGGGGGLADRRGQNGRPSTTRPPRTSRPQNPNRRRPADLLNRGQPQTPINRNNNRR